MARVLQIGDGISNTLDLFNGNSSGLICLNWPRLISQWKGGGVFASSPSADMRQLKQFNYDTAKENIDLWAFGVTQDDAIAAARSLVTYLDAAVSYWAQRGNPTKYYLITKADDETNLSYAPIHGYEIKGYKDQFGNEFEAGGLVDGINDPQRIIPITVTIERGHWQPDISENATALSGTTVTPLADSYIFGLEYDSLNLVENRHGMWGKEDDGAVYFADWSYGLWRSYNSDDWEFVTSYEYKTAAPAADINGPLPDVSWKTPYYYPNYLTLSSGRIVFWDSNDAAEKIYVSDDSGQSWSNVYTNTGTGFARGTGFVADNDDIYIYRNGPSGGYDAVVSTDDGDTWSDFACSTAPATVPDSDAYIVKVSNGDIFLFGNDYRIMKSTDDGDNWSTSHTLTNTNDSVLSLYEASTNRIVCGTYSDYPVYTDNWGSSWSQITNVDIYGQSALYVDPDDDTYYYCHWDGTGTDWAFEYSTNYGTSWTTITLGSYLTYMATAGALVSDADELFIPATSTNFYFYKFDESSWSGVNTSVSAGGGTGATTSILLANGDMWFTNGYAFCMSDDDGSTWSGNVTDGATCWLQLPSGRVLRGGTVAHDLEYSDNNGSSWSSVTTWPWSDEPDALIRESVNGNLLATNVSYDGSYYHIHVFKCDAADNGMTWYKIAEFFSTDWISSINAPLVEGEDGVLFNGHVKSIDGGDNWYATGHSFSQHNFDRMFCSPTSGATFATTNDFNYILNVSYDDGDTWEVVYNIPPVYSMIEYGTNNSIYFGANRYIATADLGAANFGQASSSSMFITNQTSFTGLTHIFIDDGGVFGSNLLPMDSLPISLLPAVPVANDAIYFGVASSVYNSRFNNLVLNIGTTASGNIQLLWEYYNGSAWTTLPVADNTAGFFASGSNIVNFDIPDDLSIVGVNSITGWWIRARVSSVSGSVTIPTQQTDAVYTAKNSIVTFSSAVGGDIDATTRINVNSVANASEFDRVIAGVSVVDGFTPTLSTDNIQNASEIATDFYNGTALITAQSRVYNTYAKFAAYGSSAFLDRVKWTITSATSPKYFGSFIAFLRCKRTGGNGSTFSVRLNVKTGSGGIAETTKPKPIPSDTDWLMVSLGRINIPGSSAVLDSESVDTIEINLQVSSAATSETTLNVYDIVLIPFNNSIVDSKDPLLPAQTILATGDYLDLDGINNMKLAYSGIARYSSGVVRSTYKTNGAIFAPPNTYPYSLSFLLAQGTLTGAHTGSTSDDLTDSGVDFIACGVVEGMTVYNTTNSQSGTITSVSETTIEAALSNGEQWDNGDEYLIYCENWVSYPDTVAKINFYVMPRYKLPRGAS